MRDLFWVGLLCAALCSDSTSGQPVDYVIDQAHDWPDVSEGIHSLVGFPSITQEFVPVHSALNVVEIYTRDWSFPLTNGIGGTLQVSIREDSTNGPLLGMSVPLGLPDGWLGPSQFVFTNLVWLTPGKRHAIEVRLLAGNNWGVESYGTFAPPYDGGRYFVGTNRVTSADMWFRTGVRLPTPRLALARGGVLAWQGIPPLAYSVWTSSSLTNWNHAGAVQSMTRDYFFTNAAGSTTSTFYKVSYP